MRTLDGHQRSRDGGRPRLPWAALLTVFVCAALFVLPVLMIAVGAFRDSAPGVPGGRWTLDAFVGVYSDSAAWGVLRDSLMFAVGVSMFSTALAAYLAWLSARTDTPLRGLLTPMMVLVLVMPHLFFAVSWGLLGNQAVGGINRVLGDVASTEVGLVNIESWAGILFVATLKSTALKYMLLLGPMMAMDRAQEEAAFVAGAGKARTFLTVTVPALAPAIIGAFVLGLIVALEYFDIPLILGAAARINVFSTEIYAYLFELSPPRYAYASSLALGAITILLVLLIVQSRLLGDRQFTTVRGKSSRQGRWQLGRWRYAGTTVISLYALVTVALPVAQLIVVSFSPFYGVYGQYTLDNYRRVLADPAVSRSIQTTIEIAVSASIAAVLVALLITYVVRYGRGPVVPFLRISTWLPWAIPGTALGLGMLWAYLSIPVLSGLYGTATLVFIGLVVAATPLAMRTVEPGVGQVGKELEEAARLSGANRPRAFFDAVVRLVTPSLLAGVMLSAILVSGNLAIPIMLGSTNAQTLPALVFRRYAMGRTTEAAALLCLLLAGLAVSGIITLLLWKLARVVHRGQKAPLLAGAPDGASTPVRFDDADTVDVARVEISERNE